MQKISLTLDLTKIPRDQIKIRSFTNRAGEEVTVKEIRVDVIPLKEHQHIKSYPDAEMVKSHFCVIPQGKDEKGISLGDGIQFISRSATAVPEPAAGNSPKSPASGGAGGESFDDDIPF